MRDNYIHHAPSHTVDVFGLDEQALATFSDIHTSTKIQTCQTSRIERGNPRIETYSRTPG